MSLDKKPELNNARIYILANYRLIYDYHPVDEARGVWKGRIVIDATQSKMPGAKQAESSWVFFSRHYDDNFEWDQAYPEIEMCNKDIIGQQFLLVPKEKLLFAYDPPTEGIILPHPAIFKGRN